MPSPFPGMNPFLEQPAAWRDFHGTYIPAIRAAISPLVSPHYIVTIEEDLYIHEPSAEERIRFGRSDLSIQAKSPGSPFERATSTTFAPAEIFIPMEVDVERIRHLAVRDRNSRQIVTIIELLSSTNKRPGEDRQQYIAKRRGILHSPAHFVEIDLLRGGPKMLADKMPTSDCGVMISVYETRPRAEYWAIQLRDPLPTIPVPLRESEPPVMVNLQEVLHSVYDRSFYKDYIYESLPEPALSAGDAAWAREILAQTA